MDQQTDLKALVKAAVSTGEMFILQSGSVQFRVNLIAGWSKHCQPLQRRWLLSSAVVALGS